MNTFHVGVAYNSNGGKKGNVTVHVISRSEGVITIVDTSYRIDHQTPSTIEIRRNSEGIEYVKRSTWTCYATEYVR